MVQAVRAEQQSLRRARAERPLVAWHPQGGAVRGLRHPAVDGAGRVGGEREAVQLRVGVVPVAGRQDRQHEGQAQHPGLLEPQPPARCHDQQVAQGGQDEDLADLAGGGRGAQGQARRCAAQKAPACEARAAMMRSSHEFNPRKTVR